MKRIMIISGKLKALNHELLLKRYLQKNVYSKDGEYIGRVQDVVFSGFDIDGIITSKYRFFNKLYIDKDYIEKFSADGIVLKINPISQIIGKIVFDMDGRNLGKVKKVNRKSNANAFDSISVKNGIFSKEKIIYANQIEVIKKNIILNVEVEK